MKKLIIFMVVIFISSIYATFTTTVNIDPVSPEKVIDPFLFGVTGGLRVDKNAVNDSATTSRYLSKRAYGLLDTLYAPDTRIPYL